MKIILCGYNWIGCKALSLLLEEDHEVFVFTHKNPAHINSLIDLCQKYNIDYSTDKISVQRLSFKPDIISSVYYRYIINAEVIEYVNGKIFNLHPSLLPEYRGCSSITWAMINGEKEMGYSYHYIDPGIDTGNILIQKRIQIEDWDTQATLYHRVMFEASKDYLKALYMVKDGNLGINQDSNHGNYYKRGCPHEGIINPSWSEEKIERFIRAMNYPPLPPAKIDETQFLTLSDYKNWKSK